MFRGSPVLYEGAVANLDTLNRRVQSVVIGEGIWELCEGLSFTGYCIILAESVPDLHQYGMHNRIKSVRPISNFPFEPQVKSDFHIVVFDNMMYRGNSKDYEEAEYNLYEFNKRTQSVKIEKGVWELCEGKHFGGRCITVDKNVPDLKIYNMLNSISSLRPVKPQHN
jgi:hypothetical protein